MSKSESTKTDLIVDAARKRFLYYGIGKTTMQEIAQDAGVAVGTLYLYFSNKDALVVACAADYVARHRQRAAEILAGDQSPADKLRAYVLDRYRESEKTRTSSRHAAEITRAVLRLKPDRVVEEGAMMAETIAKILELGARDGTLHVDQADEAIPVFLYSIAYFFPNALAEPSITPTEEGLLLVVNWFLKVWQTKPTKRPRRRKAAS